MFGGFLYTCEAQFVRVEGVNLVLFHDFKEVRRDLLLCRDFVFDVGSVFAYFVVESNPVLDAIYEFFLCFHPEMMFITCV